MSRSEHEMRMLDQEFGRVEDRRQERQMYHRFSHFNYSPAQWREAAERFLELEKAVIYAEEIISTREHDDTHGDFTHCELCDAAQELREFQEEFALYFALPWAKAAITRGEK